MCNMTEKETQIRPFKVLVFGSLNLDHVYEVDHMAVPGETIASKSSQTFCGGKGLNQAIAFAKAGAETYLAGKIGEDGEKLRKACENNGIYTDFLMKGKSLSGNAVIQVDRQGQNSIVLFGGSNQEQTEEEICEVIRHFQEGDLLIFQNEVNGLDKIIEAASARKMQLVFNPSPYRPELLSLELKKLSWLILNEVEACQITGKKSVEEILKRLRDICPLTGIVLTLGEEGAVCSLGEKIFWQECYSARTVDTTAAGDTFTGYFFTEYRKNGSIKKALDIAAKASSLAVSRKGAAESIPCRHKVITLEGKDKRV